MATIVHTTRRGQRFITPPIDWANANARMLNARARELESIAASGDLEMITIHAECMHSWIREGWSPNFAAQMIENLREAFLGSMRAKPA